MSWKGFQAPRNVMHLHLMTWYVMIMEENGQRVHGEGWLGDVRHFPTWSHTTEAHPTSVWHSCYQQSTEGGQKRCMIDVSGAL